MHPILSWMFNYTKKKPTWRWTLILRDASSIMAYVSFDAFTSWWSTSRWTRYIHWCIACMFACFTTRWEHFIDCTLWFWNMLLHLSIKLLEMFGRIIWMIWILSWSDYFRRNTSIEENAKNNCRQKSTSIMLFISYQPGENDLSIFILQLSQTVTVSYQNISPQAFPFSDAI